MILVERKVRRQKEGAGTPTAHCSNAGCNHSARFEAIFLGTEHVLLCTRCKRSFEDAYSHALFGWPDEPAHRLAEDYRKTRAA